MIYNISYTLHNHTHHAISYGQTPHEAERRLLRQVCKSQHCAEADVRFEKTKRCKVKNR